MRTRVGEGGHTPPHTINSIYALVFGGTLQTRLCTFETRPGTPRPRLAGSLTGRGRKKRFPPFHTGVHRRRVLVGWVRLPHHEFHLRLQICRYISNRTWYISNATGGTRQTRSFWWGGVAAPTKNFICALVSGGTFQTRPGIFQSHLAVNFPTLRTEVQIAPSYP